jgi:hypothetical protein
MMAKINISIKTQSIRRAELFESSSRHFDNRTGCPEGFGVRSGLRV